MPRYSRPVDSDYVEDPVHALGNMLRASIIGYVRKHGPVRRGQIAEGIGVPYTSVAKALKVLVNAGVLVTDPPNPVRGQMPYYRVDEDVVTSMWMSLGQAIGEL